MEVKGLVSDALGRVRGTVRGVLRDLTIEQILYRPSDESNSIAWLLWHLTRVQDHHLSDLLGQPQAWVSQGWHARFNPAAGAPQYWYRPYPGAGGGAEASRRSDAPGLPRRRL